MPALDKAQKLEERRRQRLQILYLLNTFPKFTDRSLSQMSLLRSRFLEVAGFNQHTEAAHILANSTERLKRLGEKAIDVQRSLQAAAATTDEVLACPEKLADNLDNEQIDRALAESLQSVERARLDLQTQILEIDAI